VALDSAGAAAAGAFIRPAQMAQGMFAFMGWDRALASRAAAPEYPCLIDEHHLLAERYGLVNVPTAVWIDEDGCLVRAPEPPGSSDGFRSMNLKTFEVPPEVAENGRARRKAYLEAVADWIANGRASRHARSPAEIRQRMGSRDTAASLAAAHFRLGLWLGRHGERDAALRELEESVRLRPQSWAFRRQKIVLADPALTGQLAATPEFWQAVHALGDDFYYPPSPMDGMPAPLPPPRR
jgi:hypothetical protein